MKIFSVTYYLWKLHGKISKSVAGNWSLWLCVICVHFACISGLKCENKELELYFFQKSCEAPYVYNKQVDRLMLDVIYLNGFASNLYPNSCFSYFSTKICIQKLSSSVRFSQNLAREISLYIWDISSVHLHEQKIIIWDLVMETSLKIC